MRVGYGKLGRVVEVSSSKWGESGGDNEPAALLLTLAKRNPETTFVVLTRNSGWKPPLPNIENPWQDWMPEVSKMGSRLYRNDDQTWDTYFKTITFYDQLIGPTYETLDGVTMWCGQHGTSNSPIRKVKEREVYTKAQISMVHYSSHAVRGINRWRRDDPVAREEIWLLPDARNYVKARDLKWPRNHPLLCQFDWERKEWNERYDDPRSPSELGFSDVEVQDGMWRHVDRYIGSGLELVGILEDQKPVDDWSEREDFGILINEARGYGMRPEMTRLHAMQHYVLPLDPAWVYGTWSKASLERLGRTIIPLEYGGIWNRLQSTKSTFTTPSSGSRWATAKPWECFATGTVCFFHPAYDTQGHIIPRAGEGDTELQHLANWLRVKNPADLAKKVKAVGSSRETYEWLAGAQYRHLEAARAEQRCVTTIERRLGL